MQAAVMEESNVNIEQTTANNINNNSSNSSADFNNGQDQAVQHEHEHQQPPASPTSVETPTSSHSSGTNTNSNVTTFSYDDLFPALPTNHAAPVGSTKSYARVQSSLKTQVLHVPGEERKSKDSERFGEGESKRICQQITKETGAQIEIASGKNASLTFLIKGKQSELLEARRKLLWYFSEQGSKQVVIPKEHYPVILGKRGIERLVLSQ